MAPCADGVKLDTEEENVDPRRKSTRENSPAHENKKKLSDQRCSVELGEHAAGLSTD